MDLALLLLLLLLLLLPWLPLLLLLPWLQLLLMPSLPSAAAFAALWREPASSKPGWRARLGGSGSAAAL